jgi:hypothetical protein
MTTITTRLWSLPLVILAGQTLLGCADRGGHSDPSELSQANASGDPASAAQACALLDDPAARREMSAPFERMLLERCGRLSQAPASAAGLPVGRLAAAPSPEAPTNATVNDSALDSGGFSHTQSETTLAVNEVTGTICSAYNDSFSGVVLGTGFSGFSSSTNSGASFVDHGAFPAGSNGASRGDPSLVWRRKDNKFYFASLISGGLGLWVSNDDCQSFSYVGAIHSGSSDDKEIMAVDNNSTSPRFGRFYVAWSDFAQSQRIRAVFSDEGTTFSTPVPLSLSSNVQGAWPSVSPDGTLNIAWSFFGTDTFDIEVVSSSDGGVSYTPIVKAVQNAIRSSNSSATSSCGRPALNGRIRFSPFTQIIPGPGGCRHIVYTAAPDLSHTGDVADIFYKSTCSETWPATGTKINDDGTPTDQYMPTLAVSATGTLVSIAWYDRRNDPTGNLLFDFYSRLSEDGGATFRPSERLSAVNSPVFIDPNLANCYHGDYDQQLISGDKVLVQWSDDRNVQDSHNDADVYLAAVSVGPSDPPPTVVTPAAASPSPVPGATTSLSVLGADDDGEENLVYAWSTTSTPPAPVTFSDNGTNAAKNTTATFTRAGTYGFQVVIREANGLTATSTVTVVVNQTLTSISVLPGTASVGTGGTQQFTATARDQFANALTPQPALTWSVSGGGTISQTGLFTAGATAGGPFTVAAANGPTSGTASVTVTAPTAATLPPVADSYVRNGAANVNTNFGKETTLVVKLQTNATTNDRIAFLKFDLAGVSGQITGAKLRLNGSHTSATSASPGPTSPRSAPSRAPG